MTNRPDIQHTLAWITGILDRLEIPYQVAGGLAARCYGSERPLHDIDFYIPGSSFEKLQDKVSEYVEFGPRHYRDEHWDIIFMKLDYHGRQIEFGDADHTRYYDAHTEQWIREEVDFSASEMITCEGIELPVMPKQQLIDYKRRLNREVDRRDVNDIQYP